MDGELVKYRNMTLEKEVRNQTSSTVSTVLQLFILTSSAVLTICGFALIYFSSSPEFQRGTKHVLPIDRLIKEVGIVTYNVSSEKRTKREIASQHLKEEVNQELADLMRDPRCQKGCEKLKQKLTKLGDDIESTLAQLSKIKKEVESIGLSCKTAHSDEDHNDSNEFELSFQPPQRHDELMDHSYHGKSGKSFPLDQDIGASQLYPVEDFGGIPPTGPEGPGAASGPGEALETSQQMTVALPQRLQPVCSFLPGPMGTSGYVCAPAGNVQSQLDPQFNLQVLNGARAPEVHIPTAIATPNPYAFPTLAGTPVIAPVSAAGREQLLPVFNPFTGRVSFQNYNQGSANSQANLTMLGQQVMMPQMMVAPNQAFLVPQPQFVPNRMMVPVPQPQQFPAMMVPVQYQPQPVFQQQPIQAMPSAPMMIPPMYQQQVTPQFFIPPMQAAQPQYMPSDMSNRMLQCSYVVVPNSPVQTYQFPMITGVSETIRRSDEPQEKLVEEPSKMVTRKNETESKTAMYNGNCLPGMMPCDDQRKCIDISAWCDSSIDCYDLSDELRCTCKERIDKEKLCDGYFDCPKGEDELECFGCSSDTFSCNDESITGGAATCLSLNHRCDGIKDCVNGLDEMDCLLISEEQEAHQLPVVSYSKGFLYKNWKGTWYHVCTTTSWQFEACSAELGHLASVPAESYTPISDNSAVVITHNEEDIQLSEHCPVAEGMALWVECPLPECGIKPVTGHRKRKRRYVDASPPPQKWVDPRPGEEEPHFRSVNEVDDFVKNFFNSISIFDKKKYYKRLWGPLLEPYMGVKETNEEEKTVPLVNDPTGDSWQYYTHPHQPQHLQQMENWNYYSPTYYPYESPPFYPETSQSYPDEYTQGMHFRSEDEETDRAKDDMINYILQDYVPHYLLGNYLYNNEGEVASADMPSFDYQSSNFLPVSQSLPFFYGYDDGNRTKRDEEPRVVGGRRSEPGSWPWLVVIYKDGDFHCGGTILKPDVILTAAHCTENFEGHYFEVRAGILRRKSYSPQQQVRAVSEIIIHQLYDSASMRNDIALLKLSSELKFNRWVLPACLPPRDPRLPLPGSVCTAIGWGAIFEHGPDPDHLKEVKVPIWPDCKHAVDRLGNEICAGYPEGGKDTCQGDSGGPLLCSLGDNRWYVGGIVSHGEGCGRRGEPGVYTRVTTFHDWILQNLGWPKSRSKTGQGKCPGLVCKTGNCLPPQSRCDKIIDCIDGEDEKNCDGSIGRAAEPPPLTKETFASKLESDIPETLAKTDTKLNTSTESDKDFELTTEWETTDELHSQQLVALDLTDLFSCQRLEQRILASRKCDGIVDCEDGSDELNCKCVDKLKNIAPNLICDGKVDCEDATDEARCADKCLKGEFYCFKTDLCIPLEKRCNKNRDCYHGEDEQGCYALIDKQLNLDVTGRPPLLTNGTAVVFQNGSWSSVCDEKFPSKKALDVCRALGFRIARDYKVVEVSKNPTVNDSARCQGLFVSCSAPDHLLWAASLFVDGYPVAMAALISPNWLLAPFSSLRFNDSRVHLSCWLGKNNFSLNVLGPYEQYIRIDGLTSDIHTRTVLFHLERPADTTHFTAPFPLPAWPTPVDGSEKCEGIGMDSEGKLLRINLQPIICTHGFRCYVWDKKDVFCKLNGLVICHSFYGSYIASTISEDLCMNRVIKLPDLTEHREYLSKYLDGQKQYDSKLYEDICDSVRCENGKCLDWSKIGDGVGDCFDSRDEADDVWQRKEDYCRTNRKTCACKPGFIRCHSGECIDAQKFCDGSDDCADASDEKDCTCAGYLSLARPHMLCDGNQNCKDKSDEEWSFCNNRSQCISEKKVTCPSSNVCIPKDFLCDGDPDCPGSRDEETCIAVRSPMDKQEEGLVYSRVYGELIPQCLEEDDSFAKTICSIRGFKLQHALYSKVPKISILIDAFSLIRLNANTSLSLRADRPFSRIVQSENETCSALYVYCN